MKHLFHAIAASSVFLSAMSAGAASVYASPAYELTMTTPSASGILTVYRINVASGEVANVSSYSATNTVDPQPIPPGNYHLYVATSADGKTYWLYRLETQSGRTWFISNNSWTEVTRAK